MHLLFQSGYMAATDDRLKYQHIMSLFQFLRQISENKNDVIYLYSENIIEFAQTFFGKDISLIFSKHQKALEALQDFIIYNQTKNRIIFWNVKTRFQKKNLTEKDFESFITNAISGVILLKSALSLGGVDTSVLFITNESRNFSALQNKYKTDGIILETDHKWPVYNFDIIDELKNFILVKFGFNLEKNDIEGIVANINQCRLCSDDFQKQLAIDNKSIMSDFLVRKMLCHEMSSNIDIPIIEYRSLINWFKSGSFDPLAQKSRQLMWVFEPNDIYDTILEKMIKIYKGKSYSIIANLLDTCDIKFWILDIKEQADTVYERYQDENKLWEIKKYL